jgi:hypothetical protein
MVRSGTQHAYLSHIALTEHPTKRAKMCSGRQMYIWKEERIMGA